MFRNNLYSQHYFECGCWECISKTFIRIVFSHLYFTIITKHRTSNRIIQIHPSIWFIVLGVFFVWVWHSHCIRQSKFATKLWTKYIFLHFFTFHLWSLPRARSPHTPPLWSTLTLYWTLSKHSIFPSSDVISTIPSEMSTFEHKFTGNTDTLGVWWLFGKCICSALILHCVCVRCSASTFLNLDKFR